MMIQKSYVTACVTCVTRCVTDDFNQPSENVINMPKSEDVTHETFICDIRDSKRDTCVTDENLKTSEKGINKLNSVPVTHPLPKNIRI